MKSYLVTGITFVFCLFGLWLGSFLVTHNLLPAAHLKETSREVLKDSVGFIATLVALVMGLLVTSAKATFDKSSEKLSEMGALFIEVDQLLRHYGPESEHSRRFIHRYVQLSIARIERNRILDTTGRREHQVKADDIMNQPIRDLKPSTEVQQDIKTHVLDAISEIRHARWLLLEESNNPLPTPFLILMFFWLMVLFVGFGVLAPPNPTVHAALTVCATAMSGTVFLILEMNRPLSGLLRVSVEPLRIASQVINRPE